MASKFWEESTDVDVYIDVDIDKAKKKKKQKNIHYNNKRNFPR